MVSKVYPITLSEAKRADYIAALLYMSERVEDSKANRAYFARLAAELKSAKPQVSFAAPAPAPAPVPAPEPYHLLWHDTRKPFTQADWMEDRKAPEQNDTSAPLRYQFRNVARAVAETINDTRFRVVIDYREEN